MGLGDQVLPWLVHLMVDVLFFSHGKGDRVESRQSFCQVPPLRWKYKIRLKGEFAVISDARIRLLFLRP